MPKNIFRKYFPSQDKVKQHPNLQWIQQWLQDPNLWHMNRHSVSWAFAIGLFIAFIPIPLQMVFASLLAIVFRANIPIAFSLVWITNPLTIPPLFYFAYMVGSYLLDIPANNFEFELSLRWIFEELGNRWRPFLLGCIVIATLAGTTGYISIRIFWRLHLLQRLKERRKRSF